MYPLSTGDLSCAKANPKPCRIQGHPKNSRRNILGFPFVENREMKERLPLLAGHFRQGSQIA